MTESSNTLTALELAYKASDYWKGEKIFRFVFFPTLNQIPQLIIKFNSIIYNFEALSFLARMILKFYRQISLWREKRFYYFTFQHDFERLERASRPHSGKKVIFWLNYFYSGKNYLITSRTLFNEIFPSFIFGFSILRTTAVDYDLFIHILNFCFFTDSMHKKQRRKKR